MIEDHTTLREQMVEMLIERYLLREEAEAIMAKLVSAKYSPLTDQEWNACASSYPVAFRAVVLGYVETAALHWIDKNKPAHFARPIFTGEVHD